MANANKGDTLSTADWDAIFDLFDSLIALPEDDREKALAASSLSAIQKASLRSLLASASEPGILDGATPPVGSGAPVTGYSSLQPGAVVGGFTIDRLVGRGGMGEVYLAHRTTRDFQQRVALKMLRAEAVEQGDMFERERRLLAQLDHPGIARLIDGGIAEDGRPYMAMEYVEGVPIDQYCRDNSVGLDQRLRLFRDVCAAVGYAHANLVVHRDLKPSNILIDKAGNSRLLDFGIAKLLDDSSVMPATTQAMLSPDYASPEQLSGETSAIATDIYALGVVLYELLVGAGPWRRGNTSLPSVIRRILHEDAPVPSQAAAKAPGPIAPGRIAGDLDAIVLKAMRRAPEDRYRTVEAMADDIRRHQELKPVAARSGSAMYMASRFVRRYRWAAGASVAALVALLIGAGGIAWQARQTAVERDLALAEARRSESINRMLTLMLSDTASSEAGDTATVRQMLDQTSQRMITTLDGSEESAILVTTLFDLFVNMENSAGADALIRSALAKGIGRDSAVGTARMKVRAASSAAAVDRTGDMPSLLGAARAVFDTDPDRYRSDLVDLNLAEAQYLRRSGKLKDAIAVLVRTLPDADRFYVENHRDLLTHYANTLVYMMEDGQLEAMAPLFTRADAIVARHHEENSMSGLTIAQLKGLRLIRLGDAASAEPILAAIAKRRRATFGESAGLSVDLLQLSRAKVALGKYAEARDLLRVAWPMASHYLAPVATPTLVIGLGLAETLAETGDPAEADRVLAELSPKIEGLPKAGIPTALFYRSTAATRLAQKRMPDARAALAKAHVVLTDLGPAGIPYLESLKPLDTRVAAAS